MSGIVSFARRAIRRHWILPVTTVAAGVWVRPVAAEWQTYLAEFGAAQYVVSMLQARDEVFWFASTGPYITSYDGHSWSGPILIPGQTYQVGQIFEDRSGDLWVSIASDGVHRFSGETWTRFGAADGLASDRVMRMAEDHAGNLWFGTNADGVSRFDGSSWETFTEVLALSTDGVAVIDIAVDRTGALWFTTNQGLARYDGSSWSFLLEGHRLRGIIEDDAGNLWIGREVGVSRFDGQEWTTFTAQDGLAGDSVNGMLADRLGRLWFGTRYGVSRFDPVTDTWTTFTTADGLAHDQVAWVMEDASGNIWLTTRAGVSRYDGARWTTFTTADGLVSNRVSTIVEDLSGDLWFGTTWDGVSRYDGKTWTSYTTADGLSDDRILGGTVDRTGDVWFGTGSGASRFDGVTWTPITAADGFTDGSVSSILEDHSEVLWFSGANGVSRYDGSSWHWLWTEAVNYSSEGAVDLFGSLWFPDGDGAMRYDGKNWQLFTPDLDSWIFTVAADRFGTVWLGSEFHGVMRFDGTSWRIFTPADGLISYTVWTSLEDREGNLWFGGEGGVSRYDGRWSNFQPHHGLGGAHVRDILQDQRCNLWFATLDGVSRYEPDRTAPQTVILSRSPGVASSRNISASFVAAFGEVVGVEFSSQLDGGSWSEWSPAGSWYGTGIGDGAHRLEVRSRDLLSNVDPTPATMEFEVDATPPAPVLTHPVFGQPVRGSVVLTGTAADARFGSRRVELRTSGVSGWDSAEVLQSSASPVVDDTLAIWNTESFPDERYDLRVTVTDTLGLAGAAQVTVLVDNHPPWAHETSPAKITKEEGGNVYSLDAALHLYIPPRALPEDDVVSAEPTASDLVPETLPSGATRAHPGYTLSWSAGRLEKPATLEVNGPPDEDAVSAPLAMHHSQDGTAWQRVGGTVAPGGSRISLAMTDPGLYALFTDTGITIGAQPLSSISFTPRVFSSSGGFGPPFVGIGFHLGRDANVTLKVYSRSGRLMREVVAGEPMRAGANLVRWDGADRNGRLVQDGLYVVTLEALGERQRKTLAVVR